MTINVYTCADVDDYIRERFVCVLSRVCCCMSVSHFCVMLCVHLRVGRSTGNVDSVNNYIATSSYEVPVHTVTGLAMYIQA